MMTKLHVRDFIEEDLQPVVTLWTDCGLVRPWNDPEADIIQAVGTENARLLVGQIDDRVIATILCGFDGHRGWIYYFAVAPDCQGKGYSRALLEEAEEWLLSIGVPKLELMVRNSNARVISYYQAADYAREDVTVLSKWLKKPAMGMTTETEKLPVTITWLEMLEQPRHPALPLPKPGKPVSLTRIQEPTVRFYRYLYNSVGEPWFWWERRVMEDDALLAEIQSLETEIYLLSVGSQPAGFTELRADPAGHTVEIAYFGLLPDFIGLKLGPYLLDWSIRTAWSHASRPRRLEVNTCTLDHPAALPTYQKAGFTPFRQESRQIPDPRLSGILPYDLPLPTTNLWGKGKRRKSTETKK